MRTISFVLAILSIAALTIAGCTFDSLKVDKGDFHPYKPAAFEPLPPA